MVHRAEDAAHPVAKNPARELPVVLRPGEDGYVVAECPVLPGCISQGRTREDALANIREAIELAIESGDEPRGEVTAVIVAP
jgi:predicted RNase H-like HicB family nuclease